MAEKIRLDVTLHERGFVDSREKAKALIMAGQVYVDNHHSHYYNKEGRHQQSEREVEDLMQTFLHLACFQISFYRTALF